MLYTIRTWSLDIWLLVLRSITTKVAVEYWVTHYFISLKISAIKLCHSGSSESIVPISFTPVIPSFSIMQIDATRSRWQCIQYCVQFTRNPMANKIKTGNSIIYESLHQQIFGGDIYPGSSQRGQDLVEQFLVSRISMWEALPPRQRRTGRSDAFPRHQGSNSRSRRYLGSIHR